MASMWNDNIMMNDFSPALMSTGICPISVFDKFGSDMNLCVNNENSLFDFPSEQNFFPSIKPTTTTDILNTNEIKKENILDEFFDFNLDNYNKDMLDFGADLDLINTLTKDNLFEDGNFIDFASISADDVGINMKDNFDFNFIKSEPNDDEPNNDFSLENPENDDLSLESILQTPSADEIDLTTIEDDKRNKLEPVDNNMRDVIDSSAWNEFSGNIDNNFPDSTNFDDDYFNTHLEMDEEIQSPPLQLPNISSTNIWTSASKQMIVKNLSNDSGNKIVKPVKRVVVCNSDKSKNVICKVVKASYNQSGGKLIIKNHLGGKALLVPKKQYDQNNLKINVVTTKGKIVPPKKIVPSKKPNNNNSCAKSLFPKNGFTKILTIDNSEPEIIRPETPQSLVGSDDEIQKNPPTPKTFKRVLPTGKYQRYYQDDDCMNSASYKCMPLAEVTGQNFSKSDKSLTPGNSPIRTSELDAFYNKNSMSLEALYNKNAANIDHDYGFSSRIQSLKSSSAYSIEHLGIQTPSASEPPTDSDEESNNVYIAKPQEFTNKERKRNRKRKASCSDKEIFENCPTPTHVKKIHQTSFSSSSTFSTTTSGSANLKLIPSGSGNSVQHKIVQKIPMPVVKKILLRGEGLAASGANLNKVSAKRGAGGRLSGNSRVFTPTERYLHNTNEQVRRIEMRHSFEELRCLIPNLTSKPKAPKVAILQEAKIYCEELNYRDMKLQTQVNSLKQHQNRLRSILSQLRRNAASKR